MMRLRAKKDGLSAEDLFDFLEEDVSQPIEKSFLREYALGECSPLNDREKHLIKMRYWSGMTLNQAAEKLGIGPGTTRVIQIKALKKLRWALLRANPALAKEKRRIEKREAYKRAKEWKEAQQRLHDKQLAKEKDLPCPDYLFLKRGSDGEMRLEIPLEYAAQFKPVMTATYKRWLKEKSQCERALKELEEDEMEFGKTEHWRVE